MHTTVPLRSPPMRTLLLLQLLPAAASMRVAVFGGSGYLGSRVCQTLVGAGCSVLSVSRTGKPPARAEGSPWSSQVQR